MKKTINITKIIFIIFIITSCQKDIKREVSTGQLIGFVALSEEEDHRDILVKVKDSRSSLLSHIEALTDAEGFFTINELKSGTYNIYFEKDGYCKHKIANYQFTGRSELTYLSMHEHKIMLYKLPQHEVSDLIILGQNDNKLMLQVQIINQIEQLSYSPLRYYLSNTSEVSYDRYIVTDVLFQNSQLEFANYFIEIDDLQFIDGLKLYLKIYPAAETKQSYKDIYTGLEIFTSINANNASEVVNTILIK
ncbi:carboxypeptidase-like regulatory domain-containing protein [Alkalitalea saponilacus]|uniref:Carboxypeptidase regulatory-like domain-containing protein n=1 Tax=Alkalitalea saponilacus TaxID=889453 RepID=A0A1T5HRX1_9BACT|nr:carboxypeptidase-like regulatory domain-containing protein [Alkalitalea saponilacus]ASB50041.1 hypothetical protein CDL62_13295 [Alkalitalea saponilacus]SKC23443.1 hypothetical protein SAMN03080601_02717 [Alkalitalea saponilacus]